MRLFRSSHAFVVSCVLVSVLLGAGSALFGVCGPFTDVAADSFCPFVLEIFTLGITTGTTPTTYDPAANVTRLQMAAFLSRTVDGTLRRGSRRAALRRFWTTQGAASLGVTTLGGGSTWVESDGTDVWVSIGGVTGAVQHVAGENGRVLETWTGLDTPQGTLSAMGRIFVAGRTNPGRLYQVDPSQPPGAATAVASNLGNNATGIAFDGGRIWTTNVADFTPGSGSVSIVTPGASIPWSVTTVSLGFNLPLGILYDGSNIWATDFLANTLLKLDPAGAILQTVTVGGANPVNPVFDGANIWVPENVSSTVSVVRASNGVVLATLTGNGLSNPNFAAFDGQRILVTNLTADTVSLWKAADLTPIGSFAMGGGVSVACSDGLHFWITRIGGGLARF